MMFQWQTHNSAIMEDTLGRTFFVVLSPSLLALLALVPASVVVWVFSPLRWSRVWFGSPSVSVLPMRRASDAVVWGLLVCVQARGATSPEHPFSLVILLRVTVIFCNDVQILQCLASQAINLIFTVPCLNYTSHGKTSSSSVLFCVSLHFFCTAHRKIRRPGGGLCHCKGSVLIFCTASNL